VKDNRPAIDDSCVIRNVSRLLTEEPALEAVAFATKTKRLQMATLGNDTGGRLAQRVAEALAPPEGAACGVVGADGICPKCGVAPSTHAEIGRVVVKQIMGNTLVEKQTCPTSVKFWHWSDLRWPKFVPREAHHLTAEHTHDESEWQALALLAGGCLVAGLAGYFAENAGAPGWLILSLWLTCYVCGAWEAAEETWGKIRHGVLDVHFLMLAVALGAASIGAWREGALLLFLFSASGAMEHYADGRTRREIGALLRGAPKTANVVGPDGRVSEVPVADLAKGQIVRVTGGQQVPVDLRVVRGESSCDESNLTGESVPVTKVIGDTALGGTLNLNGVLDGRVLRPAAESALQKIIGLIEDSQKMRAPSQRFTDRFGTKYTYGVLGLSALMFLVWWLIFRLPPFKSDAGSTSAFYRAMTLLVVASPCALVLSIPSAILSAIAAGARRGVLFRGGSAVESLANVQTVAMDKTGTLTEGNLQVVKVESFPPGAEAEIERIAFNLDRFSDHPLSRATQRYARRKGLMEEEPANFESVAGQGLRAGFGGRTYALGRRKFVAPEADVSNILPHDGAEVWVGGPGLFGRLLFQDRARPEAAKLLRDLNADGVRTVMLTGDRRAAAEKLAQEVGLSEVRAELLPEEKVRCLEELKEGGTRKVAMIGDGVNDAPCLAAADVGVAMGARGSDAALEQAEIVLMNDKLENFLLALNLSRRASRVIKQNLFIALGTVTLMVGASLFGIVPLGVGVAAHEGSTVLVVLNSLRLLLSGASKPKSAAT
jgi:Zn2+/Cd2+-exporting ATPase